MCRFCDWDEWRKEAAALALHVRGAGNKELATQAAAVATAIYTEQHVSDHHRRALHKIRVDHLRQD